MSDESIITTEPPTPQQRTRRARRAMKLLLGVLIIYFLVSFVILPFVFHLYEKRHPALADASSVTHTKSGIPGDPIDVGLVGSEEQVHRSMLAAGWYPADPITIASSLRIAVGVVFKRPFDEAPVSPLYYWGRKEDLAFEKPVGNNPRERHHVRFWRSATLDEEGRPLWLGSATFDKHVGFSRDTGQFTHVIAPDVDADRDLLIGDLRKAGMLASEYWVDGFQKVLKGKNGEGDPWYTDGRLAVGVLAALSPGQSQSKPASSSSD